MSEQEGAAPEQVEEQIISDPASTQEEITEEIVEEGSDSEEIAAQTEGTEGLQDEVEKAIEEGATEEEVVQMVKQFQLKVNGKEFVKEIDLSDEEAVKKELQLAAAGRNAMQESAELKKLYEQELTRLKQDPWKVLEELGLDPMELSVERINKQIELDKVSPEDQEREQVKKELAEARDKADKLEKQIQEREEQALYDQESIKLKEEIKTALDAHTSLHASPRITRRVAETMEWAMNNGYEDVTAEDVLTTVEAQMTKELNEMFSDFDEKALERYIGKGNLDKMRQKRVSEVAKKPTGISDLRQESSPKTKEPEIRKKRRLDDFIRRRV